MTGSRMVPVALLVLAPAAAFAGAVSPRSAPTVPHLQRAAASSAQRVVVFEEFSRPT